MRRIPTVLVVSAIVVLGAASAFAQVYDYGWSISGSSTDPNQHTGTPVSNAPVNVYLWLSCVNPALGAAAMECQMQFTGFPFAAGGFTALNGALSTGAPDLLLAIPCATTPTLLGLQAYFDTGAGGTVCLGPSVANGLMITVDCDQVNPQERPMAVHGFSSTGSAPCVVASCSSDAVEATSWGAVKSLYR